MPVAAKSGRAARDVLETKLKNLRDFPVGVSGMRDEAIVPLYDALMAEEKPKNGKLHWFCHDTDPIVKELAILLTRLHAYSHERVERWRTRLVQVLHNCTECIDALEMEKRASETTYYGAFSKPVLQRFWKNFEEWEILSIVTALTERGVTPTSSKTLDDVSSTLVYYMLSRTSTFTNTFLLQLISKPSKTSDPKWPMTPPPPGYIPLLLHAEAHVRGMASQHLDQARSKLQNTGINKEHLRPAHSTFMMTLLHQLSGDFPTEDSFTPFIDMAEKIVSTFPFASDQKDKWKAVVPIIRLLSDDSITNFGLHRTILVHLHDVEDHFVETLRTLPQLMKKLGKKLWADESAEYPQVVFDSIKDNPRYTNLIVEHDPLTDKAWHLTLFLEFLRSVWDLPAFGDVLAKFAAYTFEEVQHERFESARPYVMDITAQILSATLSKAASLKSVKHRKIALSVIDIHFDILLLVAFEISSQRDRGWEGARKSTRALVRAVLKSNVEDVAEAFIMISSLSSSTDADAVRKITPTSRPLLWSKVYSSADKKDSGAIKMVVEIASATASLSRLQKRAISRSIWTASLSQKKNPPKELLEAVESVVDGINNSLATFQSGFLDCISRFANANSVQELKELLAKEGTIKNLTFLLMSPIEDFNVAAQTLISQAFDVDGRVDCFRAIIKAFPEPSFDGIIEYLTRFNDFAPQIPEACAAAKALVRCMADVNEVLGTSPNALLKDKAFTTKTYAKFSLDGEVPKLWKAMTQSITVIIKYTVPWSIFFEKKEMTEWMRDALIFARDLLECRQPFEAVMDAKTIEVDVFASPKKRKSQQGKAMVEDLQGLLRELQAWLRLTDMELLYQAFHLLKSMFQCFSQADAKPSQDAIEKLAKFIESNKQTKDVKRSYLNEADLAELESTLANFEEKEIVELESDDDSDIQLISVSKGKQRESSSEVEEIEPPPRKLKKGKEPVRAKNLKQSQLSLSSPSKSTKVKRRELKFEGTRPLHKTTSPPTSLPVSEQSSSSSSEDEAGPSLKDLTTRQEKLARARQQPTSKMHQSRSSSPGRGLQMISETLRHANETEARRKEEARRMENFQKRQQEKEKVKERRKIQLIEEEQVRVQREAAKERARKQEEAKRTAMRLKPDLAPLHKTILSWKYDHDGDEPPDFHISKLTRLPDTFTEYDHYLKVFEPLLTLECWSQIRKSKEEPAEMTYCTIQGRSHNSNWLDLEVLINSPPPDWRLNAETDVVLLRHPQSKVCIMAKVVAYRKGPEGAQANLTICKAALEADPGLTAGTTWQLQFVLNLNTLHREFSALIGLQYCDLNYLIYRPRLQEPSKASPSEVQKAMQGFRVNEPQAKAILAAMSTNGFSLIQGPPGTGKTWTICGLVGAFISSRPVRPNPVGVPGRGPPVKGITEKILVCAPSNAAIDEVAKRLVDGVRTSSGDQIRLKVVRVGNDSVINVSVKNISLDSLVAQRLTAEGLDGGIDASEAARIQAEIETVKETRDKKLSEMQKVQNNAQRSMALQQECDALRTKRVQLSQRLDKLKDNRKAQSRALDAYRRQFRQEILSEADVVCTTLSGSGSEQLISMKFSMVIIDEAAQAVELSSLIPLKYQCEKYVMVGDPKQLPPTVLSPMALKWGYDQSLFVRMQKSRPDAVHLLSIQYRMNPQISRLPSKVFYENRLEDGPDMDKRTAQPWHHEPRFGIYKFFNAVRGREQESTAGHSIVNREEVDIIVALYSRLTKQFSATVDFDYRIGIVTMYRAQLAELKRAFRSRFGSEILGKVDFNTVDGFQGQEKDIIILSCVRAGTSTKTIGFLSDTRRVNVGITRCRSSLYIVGHAATLERCDKTWKVIVDDARTRQCLIDLNDLSIFTKNVPYSQLAGVPPVPSGEVKGEKPDGAGVTSPKNPSKSPPKRKLPKGATRKTKDTRDAPPHLEAPSSATPARDPSLEDGEITPVTKVEHTRRASFSDMDVDSGLDGARRYSVGDKRPAPVDHPPRLPPEERHRAQAGSSKDARKHPNGHIKKSKNDDQKRAQRELERFQKRKQQNNLFIRK